MFVYAIKACDARMRVKIGVSENPLVRLAQLQTGSASRLEIIHVMRCRVALHAFDIERRLHAELIQFRAWDAGEEWFNSGAMSFLKKQGKLAARPYASAPQCPACVEFYCARYRGDPLTVTERLKLTLALVEVTE